MMTKWVPKYKNLLICSSLLIMLACGEQDPAFDEISEAKKNEDDVKVHVESDGPSGSINDQGTPIGREPSGGEETDDTSGEGDPDTVGDDLTEGDGPGDDSDEGGEDTEDGFDYELVEMNLIQEGNNKVDILWVVDNSGSMSEEQTYLGNNFENFIIELNNQNSDFQTAVTSTDVCNSVTPFDLQLVMCPSNSGSKFHQGDFMGESNNKVLRKGDSDLIARFSDYTDVGVDGSGFEHGLKAAEMAIAKSLSGDIEELVRDDAFLAVIVVSDEEDDGIGLGMTDGYSGRNYVQEGLTSFQYTHHDLINYLSTAKGNGKFSISAITGTRLANDDMCSSPHSKPKEEGTQYINAAEQTGGVIQSICATDWDESLYQLGKDIEAQIKQVALERIPLRQTIKVKINGEIMDEWQYLEGTNAIKFNTDSIPEIGDEIKISFHSQK